MSKLTAKRVIQKAGFEMYYFLKGNFVPNALKEIRNTQQNPFDDGSCTKQDEYLYHLINHANKTVPFYKTLGYQKFEEFPVIQKSFIRANFESFRSSEYLDKKLFKVYTSGSTGAPFKLYWNSKKKLKNTADVLYFFDKTNYQIGNSLYELEVWRRHNMRPRIKNFMQSTIQFDVSHLNDLRIQQLIDLIVQDKNDKNILGFSSGLEVISQYLERNNMYLDNKGIKGIVANSEYLNEYTRSRLQNHFKCPVYSRYSNEELGILAHQTDDSNGMFELNWSSFYFEILAFDQDIPVQDGQMGRLVVTDLFNYAMPIIRYNTGDVAQFETGADGRRYLRSVEGRKMDVVYATDGRLISSYVVYTIFYDLYDQLKQFQFIQVDSNSYHIKLIPYAVFDDEKTLLDRIRLEFGAEANVSIEIVDEIPPLASGKRRKVVNLMNQSNGVISFIN